MLKIIIPNIKIVNTKYIRLLCSASSYINNADKYVIINSNIAACEKHVDEIQRVLKENLFLYDNFISGGEHDELMNEVNKSFRRAKYEYDHWDGVSFLCFIML